MNRPELLVITDIPSELFRRRLGSRADVRDTRSLRANSEEERPSRDSGLSYRLVVFVVTEPSGGDRFEGLGIADSDVLVLQLPRRIQRSIGTDSMDNENSDNFNILKAKKNRVKIVSSSILNSLIFKEAIFDARAAAYTEQPYSFAYLDVLSDVMIRCLDSLAGSMIRLIVTDLDNTLWPGELAESRETIQLGETTAEGRAYRELRKELGFVRRIGVSLAALTRNEPSEVVEFMNDHPEIELKPGDFSFVVGGFGSKTAAMEDVVESLSMDPSQILYIDDSKHERESMRARFPQMHIIDQAGDPVQTQVELTRILFPQRMFATEIDRHRGDSSEAEKRRKGGRVAHMKRVGPHFDTWLESLRPMVSIHRIQDESDIKRIDRALSLLNKTHQFNLNPRRLNRAELLGWLRGPSHRFFMLDYRDDLSADPGIGLLGYVESSGRLEICDFILSCRVMGRAIEWAMIEFLVKTAGGKELGFYVDPHERGAAARAFAADLDLSFLPGKAVGFGNSARRLKFPGKLRQGDTKEEGSDN